MLKISWNIKIGNYQLGILDGITIHNSVELLSDTCEIRLPAQAYGKAFEIEKKVSKGDKVEVLAGYDGESYQEFSGYVHSIADDNGSLVVRCEDAMFLARKPMKNQQLKNVSVAQLLEAVAQVMGEGITSRTSYGMTWDKFVIENTNGYDVLKKIQEECRLNIYVQDRVLVAEPADVLNGNKVVPYDFEKNIEKADLKYRRSDEKEYEVTVEGIDKNGKRETLAVGKAGGEKRKIIVTAWTNKEDLRVRGLQEMKFLAYDGYEGSITAWGIPFVQAGYAASLHDADYEYKNGTYFVPTVKTEVSRSGIVRTVHLGKKIR